LASRDGAGVCEGGHGRRTRGDDDTMLPEVLGSRLCNWGCSRCQRGTENTRTSDSEEMNDQEQCTGMGRGGGPLCFLERWMKGWRRRHGMRLSPRDHRRVFWGTFMRAWRGSQSAARRLTRKVGQDAVHDPQFYVARIVLALTAAGLAARKRQSWRTRKSNRLRPRAFANEIKLWWGVTSASLPSGAGVFRKS